MKVLKLLDKDNNPVALDKHGQISKDKLPIRIIDYEEIKERSFYLKKGTKIGSGLYLNSQK